MANTEESRKKGPEYYERKRRDTAKHRAKPGNKEKYTAYNQQLRAERLEWLRQYKLGRGCVDCGYKAHHAALELDHTEPLMAPSARRVAWTSMGVKRRDAELAKCVVRCANCHAIRHHDAGGVRR